MSRLAWYWHRLGAMDPGEIARRVKKKGVQFVDARKERDWTSIPINAGRNYPILPQAGEAPATLRDALRRDAAEILHGRWHAFGHLPIQVSDPPEWHKDYLAGVDLSTEASAFELDHRSLPKGADIKLIWELSRWQQITRLAMAAHVQADANAAWKCVHWLEHWVRHNAPYRGWNWTSALESGMRLIQFAWIDALLQPFAECETELEQLRYDILPAHIWFTWRHKSFGSSANNHLLGELAGLIVTTVRWPELAAWGAPLGELHAAWEREVLAQFAPDGGNKEQALHYQLFSFELCWHARQALAAAGCNINAAVEERLRGAAMFFMTVHGSREAWDYGDSDDACVLPLFFDQHFFPREWSEWMKGAGEAIGFWIGKPPTAGRTRELTCGHWREFPQSGIAIFEQEKLFLRFDLSPLGYLATAAHGHLDALHLSLWIDDVAMIIDPGTGAYYGDQRLRAWLASRRAHNGPSPQSEEWPRRLGTFLWSEHHAVPRVSLRQSAATSEFSTPAGVFRRSVTVSSSGEATVEDFATGTACGFTVLWQFAPGTKCERLAPRRFLLQRHGKVLQVGVGESWDVVDLVAAEPARETRQLDGIVSPRFRATTWAPHLKLTVNAGAKPCLFTTTFLASPVP